MEKQEFKTFCHNLFLKYGFTKVKKMYYLKCKDILCGISLNHSMAQAYYVDLDFFVGEYNDKKIYPTISSSDMGRCFVVPSKCKDSTGKYFMDGCIEYEHYTIEEIEPYFVETIEKYVLPLTTEGTKYVLENRDFYLKDVFKHEMDTVLNKLNVPYSSDSHDNCNRC